MGLGCRRAGLEPDKGALSHKETARIKAIGDRTGPEGIPRMVTKW